MIFEKYLHEESLAWMFNNKDIDFNDLLFFIA